MPEAQPQITKFEQLKVDAVMHRERIAEMDPAAFSSVESLAQWIKIELGFNLVPLFEAVTDAVHEDIVPELNELGDQLDRIEEGLEDTLTPETSEDILKVFDAGRAVCNLLEKMAKHTDQVTKKRVNDAIRTYREREVTMRDVVVAITMPDEPEPTAGAAPVEALEDAGTEDAAPDDPAVAPDEPGQGG